MKYRRGYYKKDGTYVQGHFVNARNKSMRNKKNKSGCTTVFILGILLTIFLSCTDTTSNCETKRCSDFQTQSEAQQIFDLDRICYGNLDNDNDGLACENLPN